MVRQGGGGRCFCSAITWLPTKGGSRSAGEGGPAMTVHAVTAATINAAVAASGRVAGSDGGIEGQPLDVEP